MAQGISLHIGLNHVDPAKYDGWDGELAGCLNDAAGMRELAASLGYGATSLLDERATVRRVTTAITAAATDLAAGDIFFLSYSGHGGQVPDTNGDESIRDAGEIGATFDDRDETWVLWDRMFVDDELYALWSLFPAKCRIVVLSDSCHSGTMSKLPPWEMPAVTGRYRRMPREVEQRTYAQRKRTYDRVQKETPTRSQSPIKATVAMISGCQDNQLSSDGDTNGLFTQQLRAAWGAGEFLGNLRQLRTVTATSMPPEQTPNYFVVGAANRAFLRAPALRI